MGRWTLPSRAIQKHTMQAPTGVHIQVRTMISSDSFSCVSVMHHREDGHSLATRSTSVHAGPDESPHSGMYNDSGGEMNGEIDLLIDKLKFFVEGKLITINGEEDYVVYKETVVPYISIGEDQNLPFYSFDTVSVIRDYGEVGPSRADRMIGKVLLKNDYVPETGLGARAQGILRPIEVEEYRNKRGLSFRPSCHEIVQARRGKHLYRLTAHCGKLFRGIPVPPLWQFFPTPPQIIGGTSNSPITESDDFPSDAIEAFLALPAIYAVIEETSSKVHICPTREDEELNNWTAVPLYSAMVVDV
ncbi:hypothetical protein CRG98_029758 [Punica granatum]|uniref:G-patch domain-containing protein n=1 Tax=Punica granatum TaxID=22663 RepID=A0A2I0J0R9_PUNGR|nr:hypothetical protein CRG98_029758 [Punica granatum]